VPSLELQLHNQDRDIDFITVTYYDVHITMSTPLLANPAERQWVEHKFLLGFDSLYVGT
jgi:hypothetical protein